MFVKIGIKTWQSVANNNFERVAIIVVPRQRVMRLVQDCLHMKHVKTKDSRKVSFRKNRRLVAGFLAELVSHGQSAASCLKI